MKSSRNNRISVLEQAIKYASTHAEQNSGLSLNKMPEYYLGVIIGQKMLLEFGNFTVRYEMGVKQLMRQANVEATDCPTLRENGRFDLVLLTRRSYLPAHIIEIKKSVKKELMLADVKRLAYICRSVKAGSRLETNYFITVTSRASAKVLNERSDYINSINAQDKKTTNIHVKAPHIIDIGIYNNKPLLAAIYEVHYKYD